MNVFYTTDDDTADGATAADEGEATEAPGGMHCTVCFHSTVMHTDAKMCIGHWVSKGAASSWPITLP